MADFAQITTANIAAALPGDTFLLGTKTWVERNGVRSIVDVVQDAVTSIEEEGTVIRAGLAPAVDATILTSITAADIAAAGIDELSKDDKIEYVYDDEKVTAKYDGTAWLLSNRETRGVDSRSVGELLDGVDTFADLATTYPPANHKNDIAYCRSRLLVHKCTGTEWVPATKYCTTEFGGPFDTLPTDPVVDSIIESGVNSATWNGTAWVDTDASGGTGGVVVAETSHADHSDALADASIAVGDWYVLANGDVGLKRQAAAGSAPTVTVSNQSTETGSPFTYQPTATNSPTSWSVTGLPTGTGITFNTSTGEFGGTPNAADETASPITVSVTATNTAGTSAAASFTLAVTSTDYDVFIIAGQSNGQGYTGNGAHLGNTGAIPPGEDVSIDHPPLGAGFYFQSTTGNEALVDVSVPATVPPNSDIAGGMAGDWWGWRSGPAPAFVKQYNANTGRAVVIIYFAAGNSGVRPGVNYGGGNWMTDEGNNGTFDAYADELKDKWDAFKAWAAANSVTYTPKGLIWCQGEAEASQSDLNGGTQSFEQIKDYTKDLFDKFNTDLGSDFADQQFIKVMITGIFGGDVNASTDETYLYFRLRESQRLAAEEHANAVVAMPIVETAYFDNAWPNIFWNNGFPSGNSQANTVHFNQSQYNRFGLYLANEIASFGGAHYTPPTVAPSGVVATAASAWRNEVAWTNPAGNPGLLEEVNLYRREVGQTAWQRVWKGSNVQTTNSLNVIEDAHWDECNLAPNTQYEYRVGWRNEFAEIYSAVSNQVTTDSLDAIPAAYNAVASPTNSGVNDIWNDLSAAGLDTNLRSLHILNSSAQSAAGMAYNVVRQTTNAAEYDLTEGGHVVRDADWFKLAARDTLSGKMLLPQSGPFTIMQGLALDPKAVLSASGSDVLRMFYLSGAPAQPSLGFNVSYEHLFGSARLRILGQSGWNAIPGGNTLPLGQMHVVGFTSDHTIKAYTDSASPIKEQSAATGHPVIADRTSTISSTNNPNQITASFGSELPVVATDDAADTLTITGHGLSNDDEIYLDLNIAGNLSEWPTRYYVIVVDANTIQLSLTASGPAIDITGGPVVLQVFVRNQFLALPFLAVWNRQLTGADYMTARGIFNNRLGLGL